MSEGAMLAGAMLDGKAAVITGGASGIGEATVRRFIDEGARVVIADVDDERGRWLASELGAMARFLHVDVTSEDDVAAAVELSVREFGRLDCMFNNAARVGRWDPIHELTSQEWDSMFAVIVRAAFYGIKHAARVMREANGGVILSTSSVAARQSGFGPHPYSAAKAAVLQLTRTAAVELAPFRVRVNAIIPGGIATRINGHAEGLEGEDLENSVGRLRRGLAGFQPYPRSGEGSDIAAVAAFLASDQAEFVTGTDVVVDGALMAGRPMMIPRTR